jgi:hypothetical protein
MTERVDHPDHYQSQTIEVIDIIDSFSLDFYRGNIVKYVLRSDKKGREIEDLRKAQWYLTRLIEVKEKQ